MVIHSITLVIHSIIFNVIPLFIAEPNFEALVNFFFGEICKQKIYEFYFVFNGDTCEAQLNLLGALNVGALICIVKCVPNRTMTINFKHDASFMYL